EDISEIGIVAAPDLMPKLSVLPKFKPPRVTCCADGVSIPRPPASDGADFPPAFGEGQIQDLQIALAGSARSLRYRFAILDLGTERTDPDHAVAWRKVLSESNFAAGYYPWILVDDPLRLTGLVRAIPPSGHIAGIYSRSDARKGVHKPPMN